MLRASGTLQPQVLASAQRRFSLPTYSFFICTEFQHAVVRLKLAPLSTRTQPDPPSPAGAISTTRAGATAHVRDNYSPAAMVRLALVR